MTKPMMQLFEFMDWSELAESLGYCLQSDGRSYSLRRESDGEEMVFGLSAREVQAMLNQIRGKSDDCHE